MTYKIIIIRLNKLKMLSPFTEDRNMICSLKTNWNEQSKDGQQEPLHRDKSEDYRSSV